MLILQRPWNSQPQDTISIAQWALDRKLKTLISGGDLYDRAAGKFAVAGIQGTGPAPQLGISTNGPARFGGRTDASNGGFINPGTPMGLGDDHTLFFYGGGFNTSANLAAIALRSNSAANPVGQIDNNNTDLRYIVRNDAGTIQTVTAAGAASYSGSKCIVARRSGANTSIWIDGVQAASGASGPTSTISYNSLGIFALQAGGATWSAFAPTTQFFVYAGAFGSALSDADMQAFGENPHSIWENRRIYIPLSISGGGAYTLNLETGSYSFTGSDAVLLKNPQLTLDSGSYSLTGSNASLLKGLILEASSGTYTLSGSNASLLYTHLLSASSGTYTINGADATLTYTPASGTYTLNAATGTYLLTGSIINLIALSTSNKRSTRSCRCG